MRRAFRFLQGTVVVTTLAAALALVVQASCDSGCCTAAQKADGYGCYEVVEGDKTVGRCLKELVTPAPKSLELPDAGARDAE